MKKMILLVISMVLALTMAIGVSAISISPTSCANLRTLVEANCAGNYELAVDLDCTGETGLQPICPASPYFTGIFEGQGHTITGLTINLPSTNYVGLFSRVAAGAQIKNIGLENVDIQGSSIVGGLVGNNNGNVNNCYVTGRVRANLNQAGGLAGNNQNSINNSYSTANVNGSGYIGGLVGVLGAVASISNCYATGAVNGSSNFGGLIGYDFGGSKVNDYWYDNTGDSATNCYSGGDGGCTKVTDGYGGFNPGYNYFQGSVSGRAPMSSWDFTTPIWYQWTAPADYPKLEPQGGGGETPAIPEFSTIGIVLALAITAIGMIVIIRRR